MTLLFLPDMIRVQRIWAIWGFLMASWGRPETFNPGRAIIDPTVHHFGGFLWGAAFLRARCLRSQRRTYGAADDEIKASPGALHQGSKIQGPKPALAFCLKRLG